MTAYYNEIDPFAAQWLRNLIRAGHIAPGDVDERSIADVSPADLAGYAQCHLFAGIGGWSLAARLAGWPDDRPLWTGSCPCQPFSNAGQRRGTDDERHLWPEFFRLVGACRPAIVMGEQVASKDGLAWLDLVHADMEGAGYAVRAADLCAAGVGAPHIRQRLYWLAYGDGRQCDGLTSREGRIGNGTQSGWIKGHSVSGSGGAAGVMADVRGAGLEGRPRAEGADELAARAGRLAHWSDVEWLTCRDGKSRPTQPGLFPLAHGVPARVGRLRAYGNAIVPQVAAEVIGAFMRSEHAHTRR